jgi:hypothetical protein
MQSIIFFTACNGNEYELQVEHDPIVSIPISVRELSDGTVREVEGDRQWADLREMTHDLKTEIKKWSSDVGN